MKLFRTNTIEHHNTITDCQTYLNLNLPSELLVKRYDKFLSKLSAINNCRFLA